METTDCIRKPIAGNCRDFGFGLAELISNGVTIPMPIFISFITPMRCRVNFVPSNTLQIYASGENKKTNVFPRKFIGENIRVQGVGNYYRLSAFTKLNRASIEYFFNPR